MFEKKGGVSISNPNTLTYYHYQDIQNSDSGLQQQVKEYWESGQYSSMLSFLINNRNQLSGKAFISDLINILSSNVLSLENYYYNNVPIFLSDLASQYFNLINNFISKGTWINTNIYVPFNFVVYNDNIYMCIQQTNENTSITDTQYWVELNLFGDKGAPGIDVNMRYYWNNNDTYNVNDLVVYGNNIYVALEQNNNVIPGTNLDIWGIFITTTPGKINVGNSAPENPVDNEIWFETPIDPLTQSSTLPIIGQFYRYNFTKSVWEEMYPNVLFRWLDGYSNYAPSAVVINVDIQPSQWQNNQYIYNYPTLTDDSFITVLPVSTMDAEQYSIYNNLSMSISATAITLSVTSAPNVNLPIIIKIQ